MDKNSQEYKLVMSLYTSGKITDADRDRLLAALDETAETAAGDETEFESKVNDVEEEVKLNAAGKNPEYRVTVVYAVDGEFDE